ncbi:MAG: hypothetical protein GYB66_07885 [Chloroflexi bacterium]|nr:hypothetical protein [Chloroflexota bacterium]
MHEELLELIPLYVAGKLPPEQAAKLEHHLARSPELHTALEEWQTIAEAVRQQSEEWARRLPPLAPYIRAEVEKRFNGQGAEPTMITALNQPTRLGPRSATQQSRLPLSLAAALIAVTVFASLIVFLSSREDSDGGQNGDTAGLAAQEGSPETAIAQDSSPTLTFTPFVATEIAARPTATPNDIHSPVAGVGNATSTATPAFQEAGSGSASAASSPGLPPNLQPTRTLSQDDCFVTNPQETPVAIYRWPGRENEVTGTLQPGEQRRILVTSGTGWYEVYAPEGGIQGWVFIEDVRLGGNCDNLWLPSPTPDVPTTSPTTCRVSVITGDTITIRSGPGMDYAEIGSYGGQMVARSRSANGWYEVAFAPQSQTLTGWVPETWISANTHCATLPVISPADYTPQPTPTRFPTAAAVPQIAYFTAVPSDIQPGDTVTVSWETRHASRVWLEYFGTQASGNAGTEAAPMPLAVFSDLPLTGSMDIRIPATFRDDAITFSLVINTYGDGERGPSMNRVVRIDYPQSQEQTPSLPTIISFEVTPAQTAPGETLTATWETQDARRVHLSLLGETGSGQPERREVAGRGQSTYVAPAGYTGKLYFRLEAEGEDGLSVSRTVMIESGNP